MTTDGKGAYGKAGWDPNAYDRISKPQFLVGQDLIKRAAPEKASVILDVGCGTGSLTCELARLASGGHVTGIDSAEDMIPFAREKARQEGVTNIAFERKDINDIAYASQFDLIYSNFSLHWVEDKARVFKSLWNALRGGGRAVVEVHAKRFAGESVDAAIGAIVKLGLQKYFEKIRWSCSYPEKEACEAIVKESGFINVAIAYNEYDYWYQTAGEMSDFLIHSGFHYYRDIIPEDKRDAFMETFEENLAKNREPNGLKTTLKCIFVSGEKPVQ